MRLNPLHCADFYKVSHRIQYPEGTTLVYSNFTARSDRLFNVPKVVGIYDGRVVVFGLQYFIKEYLIKNWDQEFFQQPLEEVLYKYKRRLDCALGNDAVTIDHIAALHNLQYLPIAIKALPEGTLCPIGVPMLVIYNTHPKFFWLTNYIETALSCEIWKPITAATIALCYRRLFTKYAKETGGNLDLVKFQGHDFSFRGMSCIEDAAKIGAAHMTSFAGTDCIVALDFLEEYYNADAEVELLGGSVPATEHSVQCMGGKEAEIDTYRRLITEVYPNGIISIVSDTYDFFKVITDDAIELKPLIMARDGTVTYRPDSGSPVKIVCGDDIYKITLADNLEESIEWMHDYLIDHDDTPHGERGDSEASGTFKYKDKYYKVNISIEWNRYDKQFYYIDGSEVTSYEEVKLTPQQKGAIECLWDVFGGTVNDLGYKVLDSHVGLIYGDSITLQRAADICEGLKAKGYCTGLENMVYGIGSFTYQHLTRDTFGCAIKATYGVVNGEPRLLFKDPITDDGTKKSAKGLLSVVMVDGSLKLIQELDCGFDNLPDDELKLVFENSKLIIDDSIGAIRQRISNQIGE